MDSRHPRIAIFEEFLGPAELDRLHGYAQARAADFAESRCVGKDMGGVHDPQHRRSLVLYDLGDFRDLVGRRIMRTLPLVFHRLGIDACPITALEMQFTASNDGDFFRAHTDSDNGLVSRRWVTFVYFCHRQPVAFTGGALLIYGRDSVTGVDLTDMGYSIHPTQNAIVFFRSDRLHEIVPVSCPGRTFVDGRMTVNGWLYK